MAEALDETPAYCMAVASFYDMYHLKPVGRHLVEVCTNVSCALVGAQQVLEAFQDELGIHAGETTEDGEVTLRTVECAGGCGWGTVVAVDHRYRERSDRAGRARDRGGAPWRMAAEQFVVLAGAEGGKLLTKLADYRAAGGFEALAKARTMEPAQVVQEILDSGLRGRGGAFFPTGRKASFLAQGTGKPTYLVVNADESEPGTFKDREIMFTVPHRLIEGCLITAHAIGCDKVFIYIRGEYLHEFEVLKAALEEVRAAKLLGGVTIVLHRGAGAYICGEETALLESLEGKRGQPRTKPPFPAVAGLYASPSLINNVETIATVPKIIELGAKEYAKIGVPPDSSGTRVFSLSGNVVNGGNYELPMGVTLRELIYDFGGGIPDGRQLKAVIPGGSSVPVLTADQIDVPLDADLDGRGGLDARLGRDHRHRRPLLHGAARPAGRAVLHARELRQVHAVPRGNALDGADPRVDRGGDVLRGATSTCCSTSATGSSASASARSATRPRCRWRATSTSSAPSSGSTSTRGCPMHGESSLENVLAPVDQHTHHPVAEVPA